MTSDSPFDAFSLLTALEASEAFTQADKAFIEKAGASFRTDATNAGLEAAEHAILERVRVLTIYLRNDLYIENW